MNQVRHQNNRSMDFLKAIKLQSLKELINAKDRDVVRGKINAEKDLESILASVTDFSALVEYMEKSFVQGAEAVLFTRLFVTDDPREEVRIVAQLKYTKVLQKKFMKYARKANTGKADPR